MSVHKTHGKKQKLAKAARKSSPAPRWVDLKVFGLGRAKFRAVKRFADRHWRRRGKIDA
ncbi:MAG: 50S ribosomal protein L39e [Candidatus Aenigmarchaeota archaeon]|nr:50S ribosomal protein L39e [Candidatus Aenigmarchaeota archaeon]